MPNYHTANYSDAEIHQLAVKNGWKASDSISFNDVQRMTAPQVRFYEIHAADALEAAIASKDKPNQKWVTGGNSTTVSVHNQISLADQQATRRRNSSTTSVRIKDLLPEDPTQMPTDEEAEQLQGEVVRFFNDYPQLRVPENHEVIKRWVEKYRAKLTYRNLVAFVTTTPQEFTFDLSVVGLPGGKASGDYVMRLPSEDYDKATKPHPTVQSPEQAEDKMSSDEYRKHSQQKHPEDWRRPASAFAVNDATLAVNSFVSLHPEYPVSPESREKIEKYLDDNKIPITYNNVERAYFALVENGEIQPKTDTVIKGQVVKSINLGGHAPGYPDPQFTKASLDALIRNLTSAEYDKKLRDDPSFRKAVDALG